MEGIWSDIVLEPDSKAAIRDAIAGFERGGEHTPRGLLLHGPPGTGKTEIKKAIAASSTCSTMDLALQDLKARFLGEGSAGVHDAWEQARAQGRCIMFLDWCEGMFPRRGSREDDSSRRELLTQFLTEWDGLRSEAQRVWVIGETYTRQSVDEAVLSRFALQVETKIPNLEMRKKHFRIHLARREDVLAEGLDIETVASQLADAAGEVSGRNISTLVSRALTRAVQRVEDGSEVKLTYDDLLAETVANRERHRQPCRRLKVDDGRV